MACRTARPKRELVRVVRTPDGEIEIDETGRRAGRGGYLCRDGACWRIAVDKGSLTRALRTPLPPAIRAALESGPRTTDMNDAPMSTTTAGGEQRGEE